jgi:hypothetical protein
LLRLVLRGEAAGMGLQMAFAPEAEIAEGLKAPKVSWNAPSRRAASLEARGW